MLIQVVKVRIHTDHHPEAQDQYHPEFYLPVVYQPLTNEDYDDDNDDEMYPEAACVPKNGGR